VIVITIFNLGSFSFCRALVLAMAEILFLAGRNHRAVLATLNVHCPQVGECGDGGQHDEVFYGS
jgi:hypothetical protein